MSCSGLEAGIFPQPWPLPVERNPSEAQLGRVVPAHCAAFFAAVVLCQAVNAVAARTQRQSLFQQGLFSNRWHLAGVVAALLIALAIIELPFLQPAFGTATLSLSELLLAWPFALGLLLLDELRRWLIRHNVSWRVAPYGNGCKPS